MESLSVCIGSSMSIHMCQPFRLVKPSSIFSFLLLSFAHVVLVLPTTLVVHDTNYPHSTTNCKVLKGSSVFVLAELKCLVWSVAEDYFGNRV